MSPRSAREGEAGLSTGKRRRIRPTHEWELLLPLFEWPEQARYEEIRSLVLFDVPVAERAAEIGLSESTLYRRVDRFAEEGMEGLFDAPTARRRTLPPAMRRLIVDLKAEHPAFNPNEIANACSGYASGGAQAARRFGSSWKRKPLSCGSCAAFRSATRSPRFRRRGPARSCRPQPPWLESSHS